MNLEMLYSPVGSVTAVTSCVPLGPAIQMTGTCVSATMATGALTVTRSVLEDQPFLVVPMDSAILGRELAPALRTGMVR